MKSLILCLLLIFFFSSCEEKIIYEQDPRFFNDAFHGDIVGKVKQKESAAMVIVSQEAPLDSVQINPVDGVFRFQELKVGNYDLEVRAENYRITKRCNVKVEGAGTTYIGEIDLSTVPDLISSYYPEDRAEIVYNNRFYRLTVSVMFTQPMDRESVEKAFSTDPPSEGVFYWGQYTRQPSWIYYSADDSYIGARDGKNAGFDPGATITTYSRITSFTYRMAQKDCYTDTTYRISLSTEAQDTSGNHLRFPLKFSFSTVQSSSTLNGIMTSPEHGDLDIEPISYNGISISFPRNMDQPSTEQALTMTPNMDKIFIWPKFNQMMIYTGGYFYADTTYTINIDSVAKDLDGEKLGYPFSFSFRTAPVRVRSSYPRNAQLFCDPDDPIKVYFNTNMLKSTLQKAFSISPAIAGTVDWEYNYDRYDKTCLKFTPSQNFRLNTKYTVTVSTAAADMFGKKMKAPFTFSFITRPE